MDWDLDWKKKRVPTEKRAVKHLPRGPCDDLLMPRLSEKPSGFRLTYDCLQAMDIGITQREREREVVVELLYNREPAVGIAITAIGLFSMDIEPRTSFPRSPTIADKTHTSRPPENYRMMS